MTKKEFLAILRGELKGYDSAEIDDLVSDYETHFDEGHAAKRSEKEIAQKLGDPKMIAREYKTVALVKMAEEKPTLSNVSKAVLAFVGLGFFNLVFVFGPFMGAVGVMIGLSASVLALIVSGIAGMAVSIIGPIIPSHVIEFGVNPISAFLFFVALTCFGIVSSMGLMSLWRWFLKVTLTYIKFNLSIVTGEK